VTGPAGTLPPACPTWTGELAGPPPGVAVEWKEAGPGVSRRARYDRD
jgi:hypothetical protein